MKYKTVETITCECGQEYPDKLFIDSEYECQCGKRYVTRAGFDSGNRIIAVIEPKEQE